LLCRADGAAAPGDGQRNYANGFNLTLHENALELPLRWKKPQTIFVNSMSDLFHKAVPVEFILRTFDVMCRARFLVVPIRSGLLGMTGEAGFPASC